MPDELIHVEGSLWVLTATTGLSVFDFDFGLNFRCSHPWQRPDKIGAVARVGVYEDYDRRFSELVDEGIVLIHSPDEHRRATDLPNWYPLLMDLTP
jgi:hypothetical protein